jgi:hypothetical protein
VGEPARHLHVIVDTETGQKQEFNECPNCTELGRQLEGAEKEIRAWRTRYAKAIEDREAAAKGHDLWPQAVALWQEWKVATKHIRSRWTAERFWLCEPYLRVDGFVICRWAVWGIAYMPNTKRLPTGQLETYDGWETCFKNRGTFERYARRGWFHPEAQAQYAERCANPADHFKGGKRS